MMSVLLRAILVTFLLVVGTGFEAVTRPCIDFTILSNSDSTSLPGATVVVTPGGLGGAASVEGRIVLCPVEAGSYRYIISSIGYLPDSGTVILPDSEALVAVTVYLDPVFEEGALVTIFGEKVHRTGDWESSISGKDLERMRGATVAATLDDLPGFSTLSTGPVAGQIVSRGVSGDRVTLTLDGTAAPDASSLAPDHAVTISPGLARRISILYGPEAFLFSSAPIGGVVDVESGTEYQSGRFGGFSSLRFESASSTVEGALVGLWRPSHRSQFEVYGSTRRSSDLRLSDGSSLRNSAGDMLQAGGRASVRVGPAHIRSGVEHYRSDYGIPPDPEGPHPEGVTIDMRRTTGRAAVGFAPNDSTSPSHELEIVGTNYYHRETESDGLIGVEYGLAETGVTYNGEYIGTSSRNLRLNTRAGYTFQDAAAVGLRLAPSRRHEFHGVLFAEGEISSTTLSAALRYDHVISDEYDGDSPVSRIHRGVGGSAGIVQHLGNATAVGLSLITTFRPPDLRELFSEGPHAAARAFEIGNTELEAERGYGGDLFLHGAAMGFDGEIRLFVNDFSRYLVPLPTGDTNRTSRLPVYRITGVPARIAGVEVDIDALLFAEKIRVSGTLEYVHASVGENPTPLPRTPPLTLTAEVEYRTGRFSASIGSVTRAMQERTGEFESPTTGSTLLNCNLGYRFFVGTTVHAVNVSGSNILDTLWYDHLSLFRDLYPGAGFSVNLQYQVYL